ncbi:dipeptidyl aminopeptidase [Metarhizium album ARSEF 1941]|uniref:Probable dipeptidyl-aminopeptidase B n=1 Tax=Metarhizium album (strain ARSEF 1941) TaxID=1081103 RepID=A0A0B2WWL3_METAS|nr:dipeptidyl aminopeptidase [Metarhizium album ARSEF 1941]KHO00612.1 dipeptidyl aminopeptidase [Metarhizium album ARSEF 1941]
MATPSTDDAESQRPSTSRPSQDSLSSVSTTSLVFDRIQQEMDRDPSASRTGARDLSLTTKDEGDYEDASETGAFLGQPGVPLQQKPMDRGLRRVLTIIAAVFVGAWLAGPGVFLLSGSYRHGSDSEHDPDSTSRGSGKDVTMDQVLGGFWSAKSRGISWIKDPDGGDGLLLEVDSASGYLVVEDVRADKRGNDIASRQTVDTQPAKPRVLMKDANFMYNNEIKRPDWNEPSPDLKKVLLAVDVEKNWRHSFRATYFILDVDTAQVQPLVPDNVNARVQLANWSPKSDAVSFTMDNNIYIRRLGQANDVVQITKDGGPEYFYGIPDWVYEEEVFSGRSATWWSDDARYLAFLRTNETAVPEYAIQYYIQRPSGKKPAVGEEAYPDLRKIKYPKPGAHNPVVDVQYYDISKGDVFSIPTPGEFPNHDRIISNVLWAGNKVLLKQSNRIGDFLKVILVDPSERQAKIVNSINIAEIDGGWFEISHTMTYIPADPSRGRQQDGYVDTVIHEGYEHVGYFTPIDNPKPIMLTDGSWEVEDAPSAVDLDNNLVYFVATKESSIQRHVYSVKLDGSNLTSLTDTSSEGYYGVSFSSRAGFALLSYKGPKIPYQKVISTPSNPVQFSRTVEDNADLADKAKKHKLPILQYGTLQLPDGVSVNYLERRPPHFNPKKRYPILFQQYSGPKSQAVTKRFAVDFQSYVASSLGYLVVTVDPRGTGFLGRQHRVAVRSQLGLLEAQDHIAAAKHYASLPYVDPSRLAIWGWSYGGFQTLKTLEVDAGETYSYGMAVAPVTDWRFYDSIYTERYMRLPQDNVAGYDASAVHNATALGMSKRFLVMHGTADDNVHFQNSLKVLEYLDLAEIENYDVHVFPDSDHSITFHGANRMVYDRLNDWLINAFNGEWLKIAHPKPVDARKRRHV